MGAEPFNREELAALDILDQSDTRLSARAYIREVKKKLNISGRMAKKTVQRLVDARELSYHYLYGNTYIEKNFLKPVCVSPHFVIHPPGFSLPPLNDAVFVCIHQGISFGSGQHPTTRLCLSAIDLFIFGHRIFDQSMFDHPVNGSGLKKSKGADIGTGSGILALAMCLAGMPACRAYEIDPVSVNEARKNIALNNLETQITMHDTFFEADKNEYSIICANLRWPTLKTLAKTIHTSLTQNGLAILSGVRVWEKSNLIDWYTGQGFDLLWQEDEKKWSGFVLRKKLC